MDRQIRTSKASTSAKVIVNPWSAPVSHQRSSAHAEKSFLWRTASGSGMESSTA